MSVLLLTLLITTASPCHALTTTTTTTRTSALFSNFGSHPSTSRISHRAPSSTSLSSSFSSTTTTSTTDNGLIDIAETAPRNVAALEEWASYGGVQTNLQLTEQQLEDHGREIAPDVSYVAAQDTPADGPLLFVPEEMILTGTKAMQEFGEGYGPMELMQSGEMEDMDPLLLPQYYLFLKILYEYEQGPDSPYYAWLNSLPRFYANGASMTDFCYGSLPPYAAKVSLGEKKKLQHFHSTLFKQEVPFVTSKQDWELCTWAYTVVRTRSVPYGDNDAALIPMADYFNHVAADQMEAYLTLDDAGNCCAYAARDVPAGSPVRMAYDDETSVGGNNNINQNNPSKLLARYGFLDDSGQGQFCKILVDNPSPQLLETGLADPSVLLFYNTGDIADEVWDLVLYQHLERNDPDQLPGFVNAHLQGDGDTKAQYHEHYFSQTLATLSKHVDFLVNDLEELSQNGWKRKESYMERHPRLPLLMRHNAYVLETFSKVQENLDGMKQ